MEIKLVIKDGFSQLDLTTVEEMIHTYLAEIVNRNQIPTSQNPYPGRVLKNEVNFNITFL